MREMSREFEPFKLFLYFLKWFYQLHEKVGATVHYLTTETEFLESK